MGLGPASGPYYTGFPVKPLKELVEEHNINTINILKIDIEGSEYTALQEFIDKQWFKDLNVQQIIIEIHYFVQWGQIRDDVIKLMNLFRDNDYHPFSKEPNLLCGPQCIEYSFIRKDFAFPNK